MRKVLIIVSSLRLCLHLSVRAIWPDTARDLTRWVQILRSGNPCGAYDFLDIMTFFPEYRNVFYARVRLHSRVLSHLLAFFAKPLPLLNVSARDVGGGLYIQHGFATIIAPRKIGRNCWVNQNVTIGYTNAHDCPTLGDDVTVGAGAKVLANCAIGNRVIIGANAVVVNVVPGDCVAVGVPVKIVRRNGIRVNEEL